MQNVVSILRVSTKKQLNEGIRFCRQALSDEFFNPDPCWNLGRLLLRAGRRKEAHEVLVKGYSLQPGHQGILAELAKMGRRRRPVLAFLPRDNVVNVFLGRLTRSTQS